MPPQSTRSAPMRSTTKPASACPTPETTKNTVIAAPTCVNVRSNSRISHGKSVGSTKWKKCDVPCAKPTSEMTVASRRRLLGGSAVAADKSETRKTVEPLYMQAGLDYRLEIPIPHER